MFFVPWKDRKQSGHFGTTSVVLAAWPFLGNRAMIWSYTGFLLSFGKGAKVVLASAVDDEGGNLGNCTLLLFCSAWCLISSFYCCDIPRSSWKLMADQLSPRHFWPRWLSLQPLPTYLYINVMRENTKDKKYHHYIIPALYPKLLATVLAWDFQSILPPPCESSQTSTLMLLCLCCPWSWVDKVSAQELFTIII